MDLERAVETTKYNFIFSPQFPYRSGKLRDNFFNEGILNLSDKSIGFGVLGFEDVYYGKILEIAPSINYRTKTGHIRHKNIHYRYIDRIIESDVIPAIEQDLGVKRV